MEISRFYATPEEVDRFLREKLAEDVYLRYQQVIGAAAVREAACGLRAQAARDREHAQDSGALGSGSRVSAVALEGAAEAVDPDYHAGPWPSVLVRRFNPSAPAREPQPPSALRAHGRCGHRALRGTVLGVCDAPLDSLGRCTWVPAHVADGAADAGDAGDGGDGGEYLYCGADLGREKPPFTCNRRVRHAGDHSPDRDGDGKPAAGGAR